MTQDTTLNNKKRDKRKQTGQQNKTQIKQKSNKTRTRQQKEKHKHDLTQKKKIIDISKYFKKKNWIEKIEIFKKISSDTN